MFVLDAKFGAATVLHRYPCRVDVLINAPCRQMRKTSVTGRGFSGCAVYRIPPQWVPTLSGKTGVHYAVFNKWVYHT